MRLRWAILLGFVLVVAGGVALSVVRSLNSLIAANRDRLLASVKESLGRDIQVDEVTATVWGRPGVRLANVRVAEDPRFGAEDFLSAGAVTVRVKLWPLLARRLEVSRVELAQPRIRLIRAADGQISSASLGRGGDERTKNSQAAETEGSGTGPAVAVAIFDIDDGEISFVDRTAAPPRTTMIRHLRVRASDIAVDRATRFDLRAAVDGSAENVSLRGTVGPLASADGIPFHAEGAIGPLAGLLPRVESLDVKGRSSPEWVVIESLQCRTLGGELEASGVLPLNEGGRLRLLAKALDVDVGQLVALRVPESADEIEGKARIKADLAGSGGSAAALQSSLSGTIIADVTDGALRNFNLIGEILKRLGNIPGLQRTLARQVKPKYQRVLDRKDTTFETLHARLRLGDRQVQAEEVTVAADDFGAQASGAITFEREADIRGSVELSKGLSADIVGDVNELRFLMDDQGRLALPFRYRGMLGAAKPEPDVARLAPALQRALVDSGAERLLDKLLGGRAEPTPQTGAAGRRPEDALKEGLRGLLGR